MIQRVQSLFLFFAAIVSLVILFEVPVFTLGEDKLLMTQFRYPSLFLLLSVLLSIYTILKFNNRLLQIRLVSFARFAISISFILLFLEMGEDKKMYLGIFLLIIPYTILLLSAYFIKKDEKLVRSADRIR